MPFKITIIYGSVREARQGIKAARFIEKELRKRGHKTTLIDPLEYKFPLLDKRYFEFEEGQAPENIVEVAQILRDSDGFIVVTGEYNHNIPPALKNILDHYGASEFAQKPSGIVSYSSGSFGGIRAALQLRIILAELGTPGIPTAFPISKVGESFDTEGNAIEKAYERRVDDFLAEFEWYLKAFKEARNK